MVVIEAVDAGRRSSFTALFELTYCPVRRYVARRGAGDLVDDVVAEAMAVLWRRIDDAPAGLELPWAYGIARRCLANARRSDARQQRVAERFAREPAAAVGSAATDPALTDALSMLSSDDQELVRLWAWEGLAPREIAVVLGTSANAVSIRLYRVRKQLRQQLERKESQP